MMEAIDGTPLDITVEDLHFRWDTVEGISIITHFGGGHIVSILTEYENSAQMLAAAIRHAETVGPHHLDSPDAGHRIERLAEKYTVRLMTGKDTREWDRLTDDLKNHWEWALMVTASFEIARRAMSSKLTDDDGAVEGEDYIVRATEIIKSDRKKREDVERQKQEAREAKEAKKLR
jgi:hypothetical protein